MLRTRILDLDGSLAPQADLFAMAPTEWIAAEGWGPRIRLACPFGQFDRFSGSLGDALSADDPYVTFYGSGDFHHVTLALLRRIREPFNLLVLDKHPDWMRGIPFLHCGTWLRHALRLPHLRRVFHCGGETDFDNAYRWLPPGRRSSRAPMSSPPASAPARAGNRREYGKAEDKEHPTGFHAEIRRGPQSYAEKTGRNRMNNSIDCYHCDRVL